MKDEEKKLGSDNTVFDLTRVIPLAPADSEKWRNAVTRLLTIEPIHLASIDAEGRLRISYDASFIGIRDIESLLDELGLARTAGIGWNIKSVWYAYVDENAQANACSSSGACCNRPPSAYAGSTKSGKVSQWHFHD